MNYILQNDKWASPMNACDVDGCRRHVEREDRHQLMKTPDKCLLCVDEPMGIYWECGYSIDRRPSWMSTELFKTCNIIHLCVQKGTQSEPLKPSTMNTVKDMKRNLKNCGYKIAGISKLVREEIAVIYDDFAHTMAYDDIPIHYLPFVNHIQENDLMGVNRWSHGY